MARPSNDGLDYFPLDVDYFGDIKIMRVSEQFGDAGELAALKLTAWIYKSGYAVEWDEVAERIFARRVMFNPALPIHEIVECLLDVGYFDRDLFDRRGVLTSRGIQKRWRAAQKASHRPYDIDPELNLLDVDDTAADAKKPEVKQTEPEPTETVSGSFAKVPEDLAKVSEDFALKKRKEKKSNYLPTYLPTADAGASASEDRKAPPPKERVGRKPAPLRPPSGDPVRAEIARIFVPPGEFGIDRDLIDRTALAVREGVPGLDVRNLKRIAKKADDAVALYDRSDGRRGKQYRWQTIADEVHARFRAAGRPWSEDWAGENEPPPLPRSSPMAAASPEPEPETTVDDLLAQILDRETDPRGETLDQTAKRLKCSTGQAVAERAAWRKLRELRQPASP